MFWEAYYDRLLGDDVRNITCSCGFWYVAFLIYGDLPATILAHWLLGHFCEVCVGDLQVVLPRDSHTVSHPRTDHVRQKELFQLGLPADPHVVPQLGPGRQVGTSDNLGEVCVDGLQTA